MPKNRWNAWPFAYISYTRKGLKDGTAGHCSGFHVIIDPEWSDNEGVRVHELDHALTFLKWLPLGFLSLSVLYSFKWFHVMNEAHAYAKQFGCKNGVGEYVTLDDVATRLCSPIYSFGLTFEQAKDEILKYV